LKIVGDIAKKNQTRSMTLGCAFLAVSNLSYLWCCYVWGGFTVWSWSG